MKSWSAAYRDALDRKRVFDPTFTITLTNGTVLSITKEKIVEDSLSIDGACSGDTEFQIGSCIPEKLQFELYNLSGEYTGYNFNDAVISSFLLTLVEGVNTFQIPFTVYNVTEVSYSGNSIQITALDNKCKLDVAYSEVGTTYPATLLKITQDICTKCGLILADSTFTNYSHLVSLRPEGNYSCRDIMAMVSQIACSFVSCDRYGKIAVQPYDMELMNRAEANLDGGLMTPVGSYADLFSSYINTDTGMTLVASGTYDGSSETWDAAELDWYAFNGGFPCKVKVNASSIYQFEPYGTTRTDPGTDCLADDVNADLAIWAYNRSGATYTTGNMSMSRLLKQDILIDGTHYFKIRWEGYSQKENKTSGYRVRYELFLIPNGDFYIHSIDSPTDEGSWYDFVDVRYTRNDGVTRHTDYSKTFDYGDTWFAYAGSSSNDNWKVCHGDEFYLDGDVVSGGRFMPWDTWYSVDAGEFAEVYQFDYAFDLECGQSDIVISGIKVVSKGDDGEDVDYTCGTEGYILTIEGNQLISSDYVAVANDLGARLIGVTFRTFEGEFLNDPTLEPGDVVSVKDIRGNSHRGVLTSRTLRLGMSMDGACNAVPPVINASTYSSELTKALVGVKASAQRALTNYEQSVAMLTSMMTMSFGLFKTEETLVDGSTVYYMHDKPDLADSMTIWKMTADAFGVSTDGGVTYTAGIDASGHAVVNALSAIGITADWIRSGTLSVGGLNNVNGEIEVKDSNGTTRGTIDSSGLDFWRGTLDIVDTTESYNYFVGLSDYPENLDINDCWLYADSTTKKVSWDQTEFKRKSTTVRSTPDMIGANATFSADLINVTLSDDVTNDGLVINDTNGDKIMEIAPKANYSTYYAIRFISDVYGLYGATFEEIYSSGTKSRIVDTPYGTRQLYCYETPTPYFGDIGTAKTDANGECYVSIDSIFAETANTDIEYCVFLQAEGQGYIWVEEKTSSYFKVCGTSNLTFSWELKAVQTGYETYRLEEDSRLRIDEEDEFLDDEYSDELVFLFEEYAEDWE